MRLHRSHDGSLNNVCVTMSLDLDLDQIGLVRSFRLSASMSYDHQSPWFDSSIPWHGIQLIVAIGNYDTKTTCSYDVPINYGCKSSFKFGARADRS